MYQASRVLMEGFSKRQKRAITIMCFDRWDHDVHKTLHFVLWEPLQTVLWHVKFQSHAVRSSISCQPWGQANKNARPKQSRSSKLLQGALRRHCGLCTPTRVLTMMYGQPMSVGGTGAVDQKLWLLIFPLVGH